MKSKLFPFQERWLKSHISASLLKRVELKPLNYLGLSLPSSILRIDGSLSGKATIIKTLLMYSTERKLESAQKPEGEVR